MCVTEKNYLKQQIIITELESLINITPLKLYDPCNNLSLVLQACLVRFADAENYQP